MKLRRTNDISQILILHAKCFPGDDYEPADAHWILRDEEGKAVGFCSARRLVGENGIYLSRAGLLPGARGKGLQKRMIRARLAWAKREGIGFAVTYCTHDNWASIRNLLACGFRFYSPANAWVGEGVHYFYREL